jgi:hypothetical protein
VYLKGRNNKEKNLENIIKEHTALFATRFAHFDKRFDNMEKRFEKDIEGVKMTLNLSEKSIKNIN